MPKAKKQANKTGAAQAVTPQPSLLPVKATSTKIRKEDGERFSKQARVDEMLRSPAGTSVAAVMKATGWQPHSVRGFFAGVVQKQLRLKLNSKKIDGNRIYPAQSFASVDVLALSSSKGESASQY
jgi:hypothetical protein